MLAAWPASALLRACGLHGDHPPHIYFAGYQALLCLFVGPIPGWITGRMAPSLAPTGRWTWVIGAMVLIPSIVHATATRPVPWLPEEFFVTGANEGLSVVLLTLPACSAIGYSIGMLLLGIFPNSRGAGTNRLVRGLLVFGTGIGLFLPCAAILHKFERTKIEGWSRVRFIIDPLGLRFSPDPNFLCSAPTGVALPLLRPAIVESLESRICGEDHLLELGTSPPLNSFSIERVKVLNGPNAGSQGWVPAYGLQKTVR
jgi:hypothetical protein